MTSVSRRVHFAQLASLACVNIESLVVSPLPTGSQSRRPGMPNLNWIQNWLEAQRKEEQRVLAVLSKQIGPDGDLQAAYRAWWEAKNREHTAGLILMLKNSHARSRFDASR